MHFQFQRQIGNEANSIVKSFCVHGALLASLMYKFIEIRCIRRLIINNLYFKRAIIRDTAPKNWKLWKRDRHRQPNVIERPKFRFLLSSSGSLYTQYYNVQQLVCRSFMMSSTACCSLLCFDSMRFHWNFIGIVSCSRVGCIVRFWMRLPALFSNARNFQQLCCVECTVHKVEMARHGVRGTQFT